MRRTTEGRGRGADVKLVVGASRVRGRAALCALVALAAFAAPAARAVAAFDPVVEAKNFSKVEERQRIYDTPEYQLQLCTISQQNFTNAVAMQASDPEREFVTDLCWN